MKKVILVIVFVLVFGVFFWIWFFNHPCVPPDKPKEVPRSAVWKGDCDGGHWLELVSLNKEKIRFRIYRDWNGELILDADFKYENCDAFKVTTSNWKKSIAYFDETLEFNDNSIIGSNCRLQPVFPSWHNR